MNNFVITNSQIGVLNTGSIQRIDAAITLSMGTDSEVVADAIKSFTQAVLASDELPPATRNEVLELTEAVAEEVVGRRRLSTLTALVKSLREKVSGVLALSNAASALWEAVRSAFM